MKTIKPTIKTKSKVVTYSINTVNKYVEDIYYMSCSGDNKKWIEVAVQEDTESKYKTYVMPVKEWPDLVHIEALKHEYSVVFVYKVWS